MLLLAPRANLTPLVKSRLCTGQGHPDMRPVRPAGLALTQGDTWSNRDGTPLQILRPVLPSEVCMDVPVAGAVVRGVQGTGRAAAAADGLRVDELVSVGVRPDDVQPALGDRCAAVLKGGAGAKVPLTGACLAPVRLDDGPAQARAIQGAQDAPSLRRVADARVCCDFG